MYRIKYVYYILCLYNKDFLIRLYVKIFTLCPKTGFRLLEKNLNCLSLLCS